MIFEVHGDVCRLGYLKLIACILEDGSPRSPDYLASILYETSRALNDDISDENVLGLLRSEVNARNYVKLADSTGFYDRKTGKLGSHGAAYICLSSAENIRKHLAGEKTANLSTVLTLTPAEKALMFHSLLTHDFSMIVPTLKWCVENREFSRQKAMETVMEVIYVEALRRELKHSHGRVKEAVQREIAEAEKFRETRLGYQSKIEWIKSRLYSKYRHTAPPRLEWLVDIGLLNRIRRGWYAVTETALSLERDLQTILEKSKEKVEQFFYNYFASAIIPLRNPKQPEEVRAMVESYQAIQKAMGRVKLEWLCFSSAFRLMEMGFRSSPSSMTRVFGYLSLVYPDKIFATYSDDGQPEVTCLDLPLST